MRVLFVSSGNSAAGISSIIKNQGDSLLAQGIEIHYFTIKGRGIKGYLKNISILRKYLKEKNFDIIHAHYSLSAFITTLAGAKPLVVSLMGSDVNSSSFYRLLIKAFNKIFWTKLIVKSKDMQLALNIKNAQIIPNGVDMNKFKPSPIIKSRQLLGWDDSKSHVLFAANPNRPVKNFQIAKKSFDLIKRKNTQLHYLDNVPNEAMANWHNSADVVLLTSLWEGSPNVIKEAMACNVPIVSVDVGDVRELVENTGGCYITTFEVSDIAEKINKALDFGKRTKGRENIKHLESSLIAKKIIAIYNLILSNSK